MLRRPPASTLFPTRRSSDLSSLQPSPSAAGLAGNVVRKKLACERTRGEGEGGGLTFLLRLDRKSTRLNSSHTVISYAVFCLKKKTTAHRLGSPPDNPLNGLH